MANVDNANGFYMVLDMAGHGEQLKDITPKADATLAAHDAIIKSSETATIALANSGAILGVWMGPAVASGTLADGQSKGLYWPALPWYLFEGQCSSDTAEDDSSHIFYACDIEGTTGVMELDLDDQTESVAYIVGRNPETEEGTHARMYFFFQRSEYLPLLAAL